jgi:hypothetical protein
MSTSWWSANIEKGFDNAKSAFYKLYFDTRVNISSFETIFSVKKRILIGLIKISFC